MNVLVPIRVHTIANAMVVKMMSQTTAFMAGAGIVKPVGRGMSIGGIPLGGPPGGAIFAFSSQESQTQLTPLMVVKMTVVVYTINTEVRSGLPSC